MKLLLNFLSLMFLLHIPQIWGHSDKTCREIYQQQNGWFTWNYKEEIALMDALEQQLFPFHTPMYQKYSQHIQKLPFSFKQTLDILRIGFHEQIFCNPWPLKLEEIFKKLENGEFTNALVRELNRYHAEFSTDVWLPSFHYSPEKIAQLMQAIEKIPSPFPKDVHIRDNRMQDFTSNFFYFLRKEDGKIYIKPNPRKGNKATIIKSGVLEYYQEGEKLGNRTEWSLFNGNGGPQLSEHRKIVEFAVASEIVLAVDNTGQFHLFKPTEYKTPTPWKTNIGCPIKEKLFLPREYKAWTFSSSLKIKPEDRRSIEFMHPDDIVHFYEDADGKKIEFGFTATAYVLSKDGRKIGYWDTGLAANFGRAFTTPHRGNFVAENLSAAGSTIMVIGKNALGHYEIYTRMFDYEINGACPGEQHTYQKTQCPVPDRVLGLLEAKRKLPLPGWKKMPDIPLFGNDSCTNRISIELTGQGNSARLLKVAGTKNGEHGYYQKMIEDAEWEFISAEANNGPIPRRFGSSQDSPPNLERNDMDYAGKILSFSSFTARTPKIARLELKNFHYFLGADEPSTIEIIDSEGNTLELNFHTNDAWTLTTQKKRREDLIGDKDGEPKPLLGTIIISDKYVNTSNSLVTLFRPFHLKMNAFGVMASDERVIIKSIRSFIDMDDNYKTLSLPDVSMEFTRSQNRPGYYERLIAEPRYVVGDPQNLIDVSKAIKRNQQLWQLLEQDKHEFSNENLKNGLLAGGTNLTFQIGKRVLYFTNNSLINSLRKFITHSVGQYQEMNLHRYFSQENTYKSIEKAKIEIEKRIKNYRYMLEKTVRPKGYNE